MRDPDTPVRVGAWLVAAVVFAAYGVMMAPSPYLLDSAELAAASFGLGIAHPPGEAVALLWGKLFCLLPIGGVAFRVGLGQAAAGAGAAVLVYRLAARVIAHSDAGAALGVMARVLLAAAAALVFAFAPGVVGVAVRPEVYALQSALSLAALLAALRAGDDRDPRFALLAALLLGLGVANHPLVAGLVGTGAVAAALPLLFPEQRGLRVRLVGLSVIALCTGALVFAYLPARAAALFSGAAAAPDAVAWGDARTPSGLWWVLAAKTFAAKAGLVHQATSAADTPFALIEELGLPVCMLAIGGGYLLVRARHTRRLGVALVVSLAGALGAAALAGFDPGNPDIRGYLGVGLAVLAVLVAALLALVLARVRLASARAICAAALLLLAGAGAATAVPACGLRHARSADVVAGDLLTALPARAALLTSYFETAFLLAYQRGVEGRRPDVAWAHLGFAAQPGYADRIGRAEPDLAPLLAAQAAGALDQGTVAALAARRPVRAEPDSQLKPALRDRLVPTELAGVWALAVDGVPASPTSSPAWPLSADLVAEAARDRQVRGFIGWRLYLDAELACARGFTDVATARLRQLDHLLPNDVRVAQLHQRCRAARAAFLPSRE